MTMDEDTLEILENQLCGPIPDALHGMQWVEHFYAAYNMLSGAIPDVVVTDMQNLVKLDVSQNLLSGPILPEALAIIGQSTYLSSELNVQHNQLSGTIPETLGILSFTSVIMAEHNQLSGAIPHRVYGMTKLRWFRVLENRLSGSIPEGIGGLLSLTSLVVSNNKLSGAIPRAVSSMKLLLDFEAACNVLSGASLHGFSAIPYLLRFWVYSNELTGPIDAACGMARVMELILAYNKLSGTIPDALGGLTTLQVLHLQHNCLSGSLPHWLSTLDGLYHIHARRNKLSGTIQAVPSRLGTMWVEGNLFAGRLPEFSSTALVGLSLSGRPSQEKGLTGPLPTSLTRARLEFLLVSHQQLEGMPVLRAHTLRILNLQNNLFKALSELKTYRGATVLAYDNRLSCHLPGCRTLADDVNQNVSLVALANQLFRSFKGYPSWVSPMDRQSTCWASDTEGLSLISKAIGASILFVAVVSARLRANGVLRMFATWHAAQGAHRELVHAFSQLSSCMTRAALLRLLLVALLLQWDLLKCPPALMLVSACLRDGAPVHICVLVLGLCFCFRSATVKGLIGFGGQPRPVQRTRSTRGAVVTWTLRLILLMVMLLMSTLPILSLVSASVPDFLPSGGIQFFILSACIGIFQGVLTSVVFPIIADRLTLHKHASTTAANLIINCLLPAIVFIYLDAKCFGFWVSLWKACSRENATQFDVLLGGDALFFPNVKAPSTVLHRHEICDPVSAQGATSKAHCIELTLLRLQSIWLGKLISSGLAIPAGRLGAGVGFCKETGEVVGRLVVWTTYAMIASGHLPLVIPVVLVGVLSENLMAAIPWQKRELKCTMHHSIGGSGLLLAKVLCAGLLLASFSLS